MDVLMKWGKKREVLKGFTLRHGFLEAGEGSVKMIRNDFSEQLKSLTRIIANYSKTFNYKN